MFFHAYLTADTQFDLSSKEPLTFQLTRPIDISIVIRQDESDGNVSITYADSINSPTNDLLLHWETKKWPEDESSKESLAAFFDQHRQMAYGTANHVLQTIRWRSGDIFQSQELSQPALTYSRAGKEWIGFPPPTPVGLPRPRIVRAWSADAIINEAVSLIDDGTNRPVALELIQEARNLSEYAPRSAVVLGVSAFEVGVKSFVATRVPKAQWLVEKLPSPDVLKILREYAPSLSDRNPCPPKRVRKVLTSAVELRNQIAHAGKEGPPYQELQNILDAIEDSIWLLEWSNGFDRAWSFIWGETQVDYLCEWFQRMVPAIPNLAEKDRDQLIKAIPSLLRVDDSTPNATKRLNEMRARLPQKFLESLSPHLVSKEKAELSPGSPQDPPRMVKYTQRFPRVPRIG